MRVKLLLLRREMMWQKRAAQERKSWVQCTERNAKKTWQCEMKMMMALKRRRKVRPTSASRTASHDEDFAAAIRMRIEDREDKGRENAER